MLPLDLRVREVASLYEAKKGVSLRKLSGREVERMAPALEAPHPAERMSLEFISLHDQETLDRNSEHEIRIFTDGSRIEGKVGAALSLWRGGTETLTRKLALPVYSTVYQAELLALCEATRIASKTKATSFGVYSDSKAALQTIVNHGCLHPLAVETRRNIKSMSLQGKVFTLHWIKAHAGLEGNERADHLAKEAAVGSKKRPDYDLCPVSHVRRTIRMETLEVWNHRYATGSTASTTKIFFPDAVTAYRMIRKIVPRGTTTQFMTGHGGFSEYLTRFRCKEDPSCQCEPGVPENVAHLILQCPMYSIDRLKFENEIGTVLTLENIKDMMREKIEKNS
ncbi:uncharacterized protein [Choristoneura fumiferana]|uniref:uncharacterized protein n=1 Tax=Choristoneura fumiferana TaxID=7141 RepID=UPI003D15BF4B